MEPESTSPSSVVTPAAFGSGSLSSRQMARPSESSLWIPRATAPVMCGTSGLKGFVRANSMRIGWTGRTNPGEGHRYNLHKLLLDPFATAISRMPSWDFRPARGYDPSAPEQDLIFSSLDNAGAMPKCMFTQKDFDWQGARPPRHSWSKTVIYETHVRGLTIYPSSVVENPGTYRDLMEKIPYLKDLGVTVVELMPVREFNENRASAFDSQKLEFREMVQAFHKVGIELILDVVFDQTAEGNELGPTLCFRGMDNAIFYTLAGDKRYYQDYTGTGNAINANHPVVRDQIVAALRYWMVEMHVDGFRFDLASVLGRDRTGKLLTNAPLLERISKDPILRNVQIIAEDWDAAVARGRGIVLGRSISLASELKIEFHPSASKNDLSTVVEGVSGEPKEKSSPAALVRIAA
jgi:isoamylase